MTVYVAYILQWGGDRNCAMYTHSISKWRNSSNDNNNNNTDNNDNSMYMYMYMYVYIYIYIHIICHAARCCLTSAGMK